MWRVSRLDVEPSQRPPTRTAPPRRMLVLAVAVVAVVALGAAVLYSRRHPSGVPSASNSTTMTVAAAGSCGPAPDASTLDHAWRIIEFFTNTATTEIYNLSLHGALPIVVSVAGTH